MAPVVLDSSIVLALLDPHDVHHLAARAAYQPVGTRYVVPTTVLAELLVGASRMGAAAAAAAERHVDQLVSDIVAVDRSVARAAAALRARHRSLRLPDAIVIATGRHLDASQVLTADRRWAGIDDRVRVIGNASP